MQWQMWKGDNGRDYVDMRDYRELEQQLTAYQIAKDNLELRYRDAEYPNCMSEDEHSVREPAWVY